HSRSVFGCEPSPGSPPPVRTRGSLNQPRAMNRQHFDNIYGGGSSGRNASQRLPHQRPSPSRQQQQQQPNDHHYNYHPPQQQLYYQPQPYYPPNDPLAVMGSYVEYMPNIMMDHQPQYYHHQQQHQPGQEPEEQTEEVNENESGDVFTEPDGTVCFTKKIQ